MGDVSSCSEDVLGLGVGDDVVRGCNAVSWEGGGAVRTLAGGTRTRTLAGCGGASRGADGGCGGGGEGGDGDEDGLTIGGGDTGAGKGTFGDEGGSLTGLRASFSISSMFMSSTVTGAEFSGSAGSGGCAALEMISSSSPRLLRLLPLRTERFWSTLMPD